MIRFYLVPIETVVRQGVTWRLPKYFRASGASPVVTTAAPMMDFGFEPTALVAADVDATQQTTLSGLADVTVIPANLDNQLGANLSVVQSELEALNLPADMLTVNNTYRQVLRGVIAIFRMANRFWAIRGRQPDGGRLFPPGITLATTLGSLSASVKQDLQQASTELGYDYTGLTLASTLRDVLKKLASQPVDSSFLGVVV